MALTLQLTLLKILFGNVPSSQANSKAAAESFTFSTDIAKVKCSDCSLFYLFLSCVLNFALTTGTAPHLMLVLRARQLTATRFLETDTITDI